MKYKQSHKLRSPSSTNSRLKWMRKQIFYLCFILVLYLLFKKPKVVTVDGGRWTSHVSANSGMSGPCPLLPQVGRSLTKQTEKVSSLFVLADIPSPSTLSMVLHQNLRQIDATELLWSQSLLCGQSYIYNLYLFSHQQFELAKNAHIHA